MTWVNLSTGFEFIEDSLLPVTVLLCLVLAPVYIPAYLVLKQFCSVLATSRCLILKVPTLCSVSTSSLCQIVKSNSYRFLATVGSKPCRRVAAVVSSSYRCSATMVATSYRRGATIVASSYRRAAALVANLYRSVASWIAEVYHCTLTPLFIFKIHIAGNSSYWARFTF